ncbi:hypothetical protein GCM10022393_38260 [Aquimarina addita]|uniref:TetR family transcriptional regulator n=1 Tax=Aquimarina addita TaxID=870485 RepID=A0ABP6UV10_9FLAO
MGRKSNDKNRKPKTIKVEQWTQALLPKIRKTELKNITMDELAILMNKSKSTIYEYFATKEEIFEYITQIRIDRLKAYKKEMYGKTLPPHNHEALSLILTEGVKDISPFYLKQLQLYYPSAWDIVKAFLHDLLNDLRNFYASGIHKGIFKKTSPELLTKLDEYFIMQLITDHHFFNSNQKTLASIIKDYIALRFEGLYK